MSILVKPLVTEKVSSLNEEGANTYDVVLGTCFAELHDQDEQVLMFIVQGHHPMDRIGHKLATFAGAGLDLAPFIKLQTRVLTLTYRYWLSEEDPLPWFKTECGSSLDGWDVDSLFSDISHMSLDKHLAALATPEKKKVTQAEKLGHILSLPSHIDIVRIYKDIPGGHSFDRMDTKKAKEVRVKIYKFLAGYLKPPKPIKSVEDINKAAYFGQ